jgi:PucR family transcriptional regulator, purine catabolism regulatory protein
MSLSLKELLSLDVLDSYQVVAAKRFLNREVEGISLLETPDFESYIRDKTLILTTLYPIKSNVVLFKKLIKVLNEHNVSGIVVKLNRYIESIPADVITLAEKLKFPLITIAYDANLSEISTHILNELTRKNLRSISLSSFYIDLVKTLDEKPKIDTIISFKNRFENLDYWIYSHPQEIAFSTNESLNQFAEKIAMQGEAVAKHNNFSIYYDDIKLSNQLLYKVVFFAQEKHQTKLYYYAEIIKMMLVFVYQKRQENSLQQNQFLIETITNNSSSYSSNAAFIDAAELYGWNVKFPLTLVLLQLRNNQTFADLDGGDLRDFFMDAFQFKKNQIRYVAINNRILFLMNETNGVKVESLLRNIIVRIEKQFTQVEVKLAFASNLLQVNDIASFYATLTRGLNLITQKHVREKVFNDQSVKMLTILGKVSENDLKEYVQMVLGPVLEYEQKHGGNLIETMYTLINYQFHLKKTADAMFVHYNTLRHRIEVLETLGFAKSKFEMNSYDLIFAVYLAKNLMLQ